MANNTVQFKLGFSADTKQAEAALAGLQKKLEAIQIKGVNTSPITQELQEASEAAGILQKALQNAVNTNTGKLNLQEFNSSILKSNTNIADLSNRLLNLGAEGTEAFTLMAKSIAATEVPIKKMNSTLANALTTLTNTIKWEASSTLVHGLEGAFSGAISYVKNLNSSLNDIRIVTGQSVEQMAQFAVQANRAAKELSTTTKAYADASLIYYQQGDSAEEAAKKAAITIKAANASFGSSAEEMSEYLTAVWNSYQVGSDQLEHYVDIMASLGAKTATSLEEIATSMQKVAATANTVGVSMEQVSSIIATVSSVTRESAESIGTSYKTIFARIGDLKLGETLEDGATLGTVSSQLQSIGVEILDANGNLRDMGDIITDLGNKWQTMSGATKTAVAQAVAGKRQYTQLMALFENWDMYNNNLGIAENSEGSLQKMADTYAESWEAAQNRVQASLESIYSSLLNDKVATGFLNVLNQLIQGVDGVVKSIGGLPGILLALGSVATNVFSKQMAESIDNTITNIQSAGNEVTNFNDVYKEMGDSLANIVDDTAFNEIQRIQMQYTKEIMSMNSALQKNSANMTSSQVQGIKKVIAQLERERDLAADLAQTYTKQETDKKSKEEIFQTPFNRQDTSDSYGASVAEQFGEIRTRIENANSALAIFNIALEDNTGKDILKNLGISEEAFENAENGLDLVINKIQEYKAATNTVGSITDFVIGKNDKNTTIEQLQTFLNSINETGITAIDNEIKTLQTLAKDGDVKTILEQMANLPVVTGKATEQISEAIQTFRKLGQDGGFLNVEAFDKWFSSITERSGEAENAIIKLSQREKEATEEAKRMAQEIANNRQKTIQSLTQLASGITGTVTLIKGVSNSLGTVFDENASVAQKFGAIITAVTTFVYGYVSVTRLLTSAIDLNKGAIEKHTVQTAVDAGAQGVLKLAFDATATSATKLSAVLTFLKSHMLAITVAITAITAAIKIVTAIIDANQKAREKEYNLATKNIQTIKGEVEERNKQKQALQESYAAWKEEEQARKDNAVVSDDYISTTESVLEALDLEEARILLVTGRYDDLATAIENANKKRQDAASIESEENLQSAERYAKAILSSYTVSDEEKKSGFKGVGVSHGSIYLRDLKDDLESEFKSMQIDWSEISQQLGLIDGNWIGANNDIIFKDDSVSAVAEVYRKAKKLQEENNEFTGSDAWNALMGFLETAVGSYSIAQEANYQNAGRKYLENKYSSGEELKDVSIDAIITDVANKLGDSNDASMRNIARSIVESYFESFGSAFDSTVQESQLATYAESMITEKQREKIRAAVGDQYTQLMASIYDPSLIDYTNTTTIIESLKQQQKYTKAKTNYQENKNRADKLDELQSVIGQTTIDSTDKAKARQAKESNRELVRAYFDEYYDDNADILTEQFLNADPVKQAELFNAEKEVVRNLVETAVNLMPKAINEVRPEMEEAMKANLGEANKNEIFKNLNVNSDGDIIVNGITARQQRIDEVEKNNKLLQDAYDYFQNYYTPSNYKSDSDYFKDNQQLWQIVSAIGTNVGSKRGYISRGGFSSYEDFNNAFFGTGNDVKTVYGMTFARGDKLDSAKEDQLLLRQAQQSYTGIIDFNRTDLYNNPETSTISLMKQFSELAKMTDAGNINWTNIESLDLDENIKTRLLNALNSGNWNAVLSDVLSELFDSAIQQNLLSNNGKITFGQALEQAKYAEYESNIANMTVELQGLETEYDNLNDIDLKNIINQTDKLNKTLKQDVSQSSLKERLKIWKATAEDNIGQQQNLINTQLQNLEDTTGINETNFMQYADKNSSSYNPDTYNEYLKLIQKQIELETELYNTRESYYSNYNEVSQKEYTAADSEWETKLQELTKEHEKVQGLGDELIDQLGQEQLTTLTKAKLEAAGLVEEWNNCANMQDKANVIAQAYTIENERSLLAKQKELALLRQINNQTRNNTGFSYDAEAMTEERFSEWLDGQNIADTKLKSEMAKIFSQTIKENPYADNSTLWTKFVENCKIAMNDADYEVDQLTSSINKKWKTTVDNIFKGEQEVANKTVVAWKTAFDTINKAREAALSGKTIGQGLAGDIEGFASLFEQAGVNSLNEARDLINSTGQDAISKLKFNAYRSQRDIAVDSTNGLASILNYDNGQLISTLNDQSEATRNLAKLMASQRKDVGYDERKQQAYRLNNGKIEWLNDNDIWSEYGTTYKELLLSVFANIINAGEEVKQASLDAANARIDAAQQNAQNEYDKQWSGDEQNIIQKAIDSIRKNGNLDDLDFGEKTRLEQIMGDTPISMETLTKKGYEAAQALSAVTQAAANQAKQEVSNYSLGANGEYIDMNQEHWVSATIGENGKVQSAPEGMMIVKDASGNFYYTNVLTAEGYGELKNTSDKLQSKAQVDAMAGQSFISENIDKDLDSASSQLTALNSMWNKKQGTDDWEKGLQSLESAYAGLDDAQQVIDNLRNGTISLKEANEQLASTTAIVGKNVTRMTDTQYKQWKQMLKNNNVTIKGYKSLEDYFKNCDKARQTTQTFNNNLKQLAPQFEKTGDAAEEMFKDVTGDSRSGIDDFIKNSGYDNLSDFLQKTLPEEFATSSDILAGLMDGSFSNWNQVFEKGFDAATGTFDQQTQNLLTQMGLSADQITTFQEQVKAQIENGAAVGDIPFLSMLADMDVDPTAFDSIITALNGIAHQIYAQAAANNITLDPPSWTDISTFADAGIGPHGGKNGGSNERTSPSKSGGGGGGSKKKERKDLKSFEDEVDRYHEIKEVIKRTNEELDKLDALKESSFGPKHIENMDAEIAKLKELSKETEQYKEEAESYLAMDRQAMASNGATFDAEGNINNYDEILQRWINEYNNAVIAYNNSEQEEGDKLRLEDAEKLYDKRKDQLEKYEESLELVHEKENEILETQNKISAATLDKITYKIEVETDINDKDLELLDYYASKYEDHLDKQGASMYNLLGKANEYEQNLSTLAEAMNELNEQHAKGQLNDADYKEGLDELFDKSKEYAEQLEDIQKQLQEVYGNTLDMANEEIQKHVDNLQASTDAMSNYINIMGLLGRGTVYNDLKKFYKEQNNANIKNLQAQKGYADELKKQMDYFDTLRDANGKLTEEHQKQYEQLQTAMNEAFSNLQSKIEETLQGLQDAYTNAIDATFKEFDSAVAGSAGSLENLADAYGYFQEMQDRNVSTSKQLYEVSKLNRDIENSLNDATTAASKDMLKALQDEINLRSKNNKLTEYDIEMMQLQYQLALKKMALDEMRDSKDTVRLTRDENGNYGYQYTADQDKVAAAEQEYEDVLQQINELASGRISELEQSFLDAQNSYKDAAYEIATNTLLAEEEKTEQLNELQKRYNETVQYYVDQNKQANDDLATNQEAIAQRYGVSMAEMRDTAAGNSNAMMQSIMADAEKLKEVFNDLINGDDGITSSLATYTAGIGQAAVALTGIDLGNAKDNIEALAQAMMASVEEFADADEDTLNAASDTLDLIHDSFDEVNNATNAWIAHTTAIEAAQTAYEGLANAANEAIKTMAGDTKANLFTLLEQVSAVTKTTTDAAASVTNTANNNSGLSIDVPNRVDQITANTLAQSLLEQQEAFLAAITPNYQAQGLLQGSTWTVEQNVHIDAQFPNVQDHNEIVNAINDLINSASQRANRT